MSQLKFPLEKNEFIAPKDNPSDIHFVIKIDLHRVYLRKESDDSLLTHQKRMINFNWTKISPEVAEVLYNEMQRTESGNDTET